jgi:hypothetical protein
VSGNHSQSACGGGIFVAQNGNLSVVGATVSGSTASLGGGICNRGVADRQRDHDQRQRSAQRWRAGGGLAVHGGAGVQATLRNSIVANNSAPQGPDCASLGGSSSAIVSGGHNLVENVLGCTIAGS